MYVYVLETRNKPEIDDFEEKKTLVLMKNTFKKIFRTDFLAKISKNSLNFLSGRVHYK